ncbi:MAG TPA: FAD-dependent oxidoreductase [Burkholderiales bacterium]|nr:FAD-dependent oxidoreductase [Burkholderiales bacterium]
MNPVSSNLPILIIGGGIGGLSVALALARKGRRVRVLEKAPEFGEIGYGIQMGPNVSRMLDRLGILKALEPHAVFPDALILVDALDNRELTRIALGKAFIERYHYRYFVIHRRDLHGTILDACRQHEEITLEASRGMTEFEERAGSVIVRCENGAEYEGAALIGADGLWSPTRAAIVADAAPRVSGHVSYRGVVPTGEIIDRSHLDSMTIWVGPDLHLVQYRLRGGAVMNNVATVSSRRFRRGEKDFGGLDELDEVFSRTDPRVRDMLRYISRDRNWVLHDREPVTNWTRGRATLLGDAAHPTLQYLAQGANMAVEDGVVLAEKVAAAGEDYNRAFLAYQRERMNRTARVVLSSRFFGAYFHVDSGTRELRNELARGRDPENTWEIDWLYRGIEVDGTL